MSAGPPDNKARDRKGTDMKFTRSKNDDQLFFVSHNDKKRAVYGTAKHLVELGLLIPMTNENNDGWIGIWFDDQSLTPTFESKQAIRDYFGTFYFA